MIKMTVTPHAGVRIEIDFSWRASSPQRSPPTRGCELKYWGMYIGDGLAGHPPRGGAN